MKLNLDHAPYIALCMGLCTVGFFVGNLFISNSMWQLITATIIGAVCGFANSYWDLYRTGLPLSATVVDLVAARKRMKEETAATDLLIIPGSVSA
jgi:hypothetical protein